MQGKAIVPKRGQRRKYHVATPQDAQHIAEKYALIKSEHGRVTRKDIEPDDLDFMLDKYARDLSYDLYTLCDVFCISRTSLYNLLKSEGYDELFTSACSRRSHSLLQYGFDVLNDTRKAAKANDSSRDEINATRHLANYCLCVAEKIDPDLKRTGGEGNVNIQINVPNFGYLSQQANKAIDVTVDNEDGNSDNIT